MDDFLYLLKISLEGRIPQQEVDHQIRVYEKYISDELAAGKALEQILHHLGDPTQIAELIIDDYFKRLRQVKKTQSQRETEEFQDIVDHMEEGKAVTAYTTADELNAMVKNPEHGIKAEYQEKEGWKVNWGKLNLNSWYGRLIILGIVVAIFFLLKLAGVV